MERCNRKRIFSGILEKNQEEESKEVEAIEAVENPNPVTLNQSKLSEDKTNRWITNVYQLIKS